MNKRYFCHKQFDSLTVEEFRVMRRNTSKDIDLHSFLEYYQVDIKTYCDFIRNNKGISVTSCERTAFQELNKPTPTYKEKYKGIEIQAFRMLRGLNTTKLGKMIKEHSIRKYEKMKYAPDDIAKKVITTLRIQPNEIKRLRKYLNRETESFEMTRAIPPIIRREVEKKYKNKCAKCSSKDKLHIHHIVKYSDGGLHVVENLMLLCAGCHAKAHKKDSVYKLLKKIAKG